MTTETPLAELEAAAGELESDLAKKRVPTRYHAREILVSLGRTLLAAEEAHAEAHTAPIAARIAKMTELQSEAWHASINEELLLSAAEHIQAVDPRFLEHPRYDFAYTVAARARLEARLRAAPLLDHDVPEQLLDRIAQADAVLEPFLKER